MCVPLTQAKESTNCQRARATDVNLGYSTAIDGSQAQKGIRKKNAIRSLYSY